MRPFPNKNYIHSHVTENGKMEPYCKDNMCSRILVHIHRQKRNLTINSNGMCVAHISNFIFISLLCVTLDSSDLQQHDLENILHLNKVTFLSSIF